MAYQVLARKWRPQNFTQLVGQQHVSQSLCHALQHNRLHHAYLFTGTRGVGKTTIARILAKAINCENLQDFNPCGECKVCQAFEDGRFMDLIEVDAASRTKVEDTRDLLDNAQYAPSMGRYKVYLIDEVHMLSGHSFNALLKTLEEPPPHIKFLLATTDPQKIPVTVLSRCLQFNLKRLQPEQIEAQMAYILDQEKIVSDQAALKLLAHSAEGSLRDGLSLLDQAIAFGNGEVFLETVTQMLGTVAQQPIDEILICLAEGNAVGLLQKIADIAELSPDFSDILQQILKLLHRVALTQSIPDFFDSQFDKAIVNTLKQKLCAEDVQLFYQIGLVGQADLELAPDPRCGFEMLMLRMLTFKPVKLAEPIIDNQVSVEQKTEQYSRKATKVTDNKIKEMSADPAMIRKRDDNWAEIVQVMELGGMTRELANNCVLEHVDDNICQLLLTPGHSQLVTARAEEKLQQALQAYYGKPIKLEIKTTERTEDKTPAQQKQEQLENRQQAAEQAINSDKNVRALKDQFDARILPGTIEPR